MCFKNSYMRIYMFKPFSVHLLVYLSTLSLFWSYRVKHSTSATLHMSNKQIPVLITLIFDTPKVYLEIKISPQWRATRTSFQRVQLVELPEVHWHTPALTPMSDTCTRTANFPWHQHYPLPNLRTHPHTRMPTPTHTHLTQSRLFFLLFLETLKCPMCTNGLPFST